MERRLQKLKRDELLQILLEIEQENEQLVEENRQLKSRLAQQEVIISEAGSIAEASLKLSGVFEAAQEAADRYVASVKRMYAQAATSDANKPTGFTGTISTAEQPTSRANDTASAGNPTTRVQPPPEAGDRP
ncbi:MAG: hypothetical protein IKG21_04310 [Atopobiaceae bacterium]|nr:hypothetical protein [Atopobiaceae bacterium]